jgi:hypothetical protein
MQLHLIYLKIANTAVLDKACLASATVVALQIIRFLITLFPAPAPVPLVHLIDSQYHMILIPLMMTPRRGVMSRVRPASYYMALPYSLLLFCQFPCSCSATAPAYILPLPCVLLLLLFYLIYSFLPFPSLSFLYTVCGLV